MVPKVTHVSIRSTVITQAPIRMPLLPRSNSSLPPGYNALHSFIANPAHSPSGGPNIFVRLGYNAASGFVPTTTQVLSEGPNIPSPPGGSNCPSPSSSNKLGGTSHSVTSGFQIPIGDQPQVGGKPQVGGHNPVYEQYIPKLQTQPWNFPFQGNQKLHGGESPQLNYFVPPNPRKPHPGFVNPTRGQDFQSNAPFQVSIPNQRTDVGYTYPFVTNVYFSTIGPIGYS
jgi:hypothetical protein